MVTVTLGPVGPLRLVLHSNGLPYFLLAHPVRRCQLPASPEISAQRLITTISSDAARHEVKR